MGTLVISCMGVPTCYTTTVCDRKQNYPNTVTESRFAPIVEVLGESAIIVGYHFRSLAAPTMTWPCHYSLIGFGHLANCDSWPLPTSQPLALHLLLLSWGSWTGLGAIVSQPRLVNISTILFWSLED